MRNLVLLILLGVAAAVQAASGDTLRIVGFTAYANPTWQFPIGGPEKKWLRDTQAFVFGGELHFGALPCDSDAFAEDYNYPTLSLGAKLALNNGVTMRRTADPLWGKLVPVDYDSHLGDIFTLYGAFSRPLLRRGRWQVDYSLRAGVGYGPHIYNRTDNIDNELIGSRFTIFFGAGLLASCRISSQWALTAGVLYGHHSNGALDRPNKGENHVGPVVGLRYAPRQLDLPQRAPSPLRPFRRYWYADLRLGFGGKTLLEDWQKTQYQTDPSDPDYRTDHFRFYTAYSLQASLCAAMRAAGRRAWDSMSTMAATTSVCAISTELPERRAATLLGRWESRQSTRCTTTTCRSTWLSDSISTDRWGPGQRPSSSLTTSASASTIPFRGLPDCASVPA